MKTKEFLIATSGATVDGREIDAAFLQQMASSYDPKTYMARLNIEHIRGISASGDFKAYGDVLSLEARPVTVNFNGQDEERTGLYATFDVTDEAKVLNERGQKLYSSVEIHPDFADKGFAYLMGVALTDSPASIATDRLEFSRQTPGMLNLSTEQSAQAGVLEFPSEDESNESKGFLSSMSKLMDGFADRLGAPKEDETPAPSTPQETAAPQAFDMGEFGKVMGEFTKAIGTELNSLRSDMNDQQNDLSVRLSKVEKTMEETPAPNAQGRPAATGGNGRYKTNF